MARMIDKTLACMIDETLRRRRDSLGWHARKCLKSAPIGHIWWVYRFPPAPPQMPGISFVSSSPSASSTLSNKVDGGLFDQSALSALAERLVEAAKRAGADAADAVAVR